MITEQQRESLTQFFAAYFHQDWMAEADAPDKIVDEFLRDQTDGSELELLSRSIIDFADSYPNEDELSEALFRQLRCYYSPRALGLSTRQWLLHTAAKVAPRTGT